MTDNGRCDCMTDSEWFSVTEASEKVNVPVETIRRYIRLHSVHLRVKKLGKKYFIHESSLTVIEQIRALYDKGKNTDEVEEALSASGIPLTITMKNDDDEAMTVYVVDELQEIKQALKQQKQFNETLLKRLDQQQEYIKQSLERRDRQLMESLRATTEAKKEIEQSQLESAPTISRKKKKGFFVKWFGK